MRLALNLAARAVGDTSPNPAVGAVIVKGGRIVGQGYHRRAGLPHAEVEALRRAGKKARGATMYVTLEPCDHLGRTPPCCDAVIAAGITRVVVAMKDPNPITNGRGLARLRRAGVQVVAGVLEDEAQRLNRPFTKTMATGLPWTVAKVAQSLDGKIAGSLGQSRWISSPASRHLVHELRRQVDAILVGLNTVLKDDPRLSARGAGRPPRAGRPIRVVVDSHLRAPVSSRCLSSADGVQAVIATTERSPRKQQPFRRRGVEMLVLPPLKGRVPLTRLLRELVRRYDVQSVLLEGGGELLASAFKERVVDQIVWFVAPMILGGRSSPSSVGGPGIRRLAEAVRLKDMRIRRVGEDVVIESDVAYPTK